MTEEIGIGGGGELTLDFETVCEKITKVRIE